MLQYYNTLEYRNIYEGCCTNYDQVIEKLLLNNYTVVIVNKINKTINTYYLNTVCTTFEVIHDGKICNNIIPLDFDFRQLVIKYHEFPMIDNNQLMIFVKSLIPPNMEIQNISDEKRKSIRDEFACIENITKTNNILTSYEYDFNKDHCDRHYPQRAYERTLLHLYQNEKIIKKASDLEYMGQYTAVYITNFGNILSTTCSNSSNNYTIIQNYNSDGHNILNANYIKSIISYDFGVGRLDVKSQMINLIKQVDRMSL
jgi:hypothetical protein